MIVAMSLVWDDDVSFVVCAGPCGSTANPLGGPEGIMLLYRPVGLGELRLIGEAHSARFPPGLPDQPIFYPMLTLESVRKIARDWNPTDAQSDYIGFVTRCEIDAEATTRYPVQRAGGSAHEELWVPS